MRSRAARCQDELIKAELKRLENEIWRKRRALTEGHLMSCAE